MHNIYLGKYLYRESFLHDFHPLLKFFILILLIIFSGTISTLADVFKYLLGFILILVFSKIKIKEIMLTINPFKYLLIFTFFLQFLYSEPSSKSIFSDFETACTVTSRFLLMILFSSILTLTTKPIDIIKILYFSIKPLTIFKINIKNITTSGIIALRFIPLLFEETEKILDAQKFRGEIPQKGFMKILNLDTLIIPLIIRVLHYADQISITLKFRKNWDSILILDKAENKEYIIFIFLLATLLIIYLI